MLATEADVWSASCAYIGQSSRTEGTGVLPGFAGGERDNQRNAEQQPAHHEHPMLSYRRHASVTPPYVTGSGDSM
jgi:hypothetical protein